MFKNQPSVGTEWYCMCWKRLKNTLMVMIIIRINIYAIHFLARIDTAGNALCFKIVSLTKSSAAIVETHNKLLAINFNSLISTTQ